MKSCPTCNRTFEDTFTFCLIDGAILSAPFDPAAPKERPPSRDAAPPQTEVIGIAPDSVPARVSASRDAQSTIAAPFVQQPRQPQQPFAPAATAQPRPALDVVRWMFILRGVVAILFGILLLLWRS